MSAGPDTQLQLFHAIADGGASARVRRFVDAAGLLRQLEYRNVAYPEVLADLRAHGGDEHTTPALWDGQRLVVGAAAVIAYLERRAWAQAR